MSLRKLFPVLVLGGGVVTSATGSEGCSTHSDPPSKVDAGTSTTGTTTGGSTTDSGSGGAAPSADADSGTPTTGGGTGGGAPSGW